MSPDKLVYQANQIATFFRSQPGNGAESVATHINKFWEPRMRRQFFEMMDAGGAGFDPMVVEAVPLVNRPAADPDQAVAAGTAARQNPEASIPQ